MTDVAIADSRDGVYVSHQTGYAAGGKDSVGARVYINNSLIVGYSRWRRSNGCGRLDGVSYPPGRRINVTGVCVEMPSRLGPLSEVKWRCHPVMTHSPSSPSSLHFTSLQRPLRTLLTSPSPHAFLRCGCHSSASSSAPPAAAPASVAARSLSR